MAARPSSAERSPLSAQVVADSSLFGVASISCLGVVSDLEVGNAFVQQYYHILQQSPELVYRFYQESSKLGRVDAHGAMSLVTTTNAINEKILSMGVVRAEMKTVDAQESLGGGVLVLVTGYLTGEDSVKRDFTQSFFLAPQDKGYYVLNDILRFVEEADQQQEHEGLANGTTEPHVLEHDLPPEQEQHAPDQPISLAVGDEEMNGGEVDNPEDNGEIVEEEDPSCEVIDEVPNTSQAVVVESNVVTAQEEAPKKSYAAILKAMKDKASAPVTVYAPSRPASIKTEPPAVPVPSATQATDMPTSSSAAESSNVPETDADGYSIYVKNLPLDATPAQLEEEFKKHGPIKPDGIQVRSNKLQGYCFGFVEFEVVTAVQSAIEVTTTTIDSCSSLMVSTVLDLAVLGGVVVPPIAQGATSYDATLLYTSPLLDEVATSCTLYSSSTRGQPKQWMRGAKSHSFIQKRGCR
ncbi:Nuclear transport factor 2 (NTF2) domain [Musa troglodytarum]|uniref:Nuclear transport factor 2 (NTF2) domain n=1 Tax=Musa troglodytarum TaxID=320322 RepID=A0A9E7GZV1_9LILI|nr:Nuclear transport factor 2 (NTF2) domain [Musa troglodytarum]